MWGAIGLLYLILILGVTSQKKGYGYNLRPLQKKIAVIWIFTRDLPSYWKWSLTTLINSGSEKLDVHIICGESPERYIKEIPAESNVLKRVFFHYITPEEWKKRIAHKTGVDINYHLPWCGRKVADFKPALGNLFQDFIPVKDYSWWVYGDSDGFFGNFDAIVDLSMLHHYDIVSGMTIPPENHEVLLAENAWRPVWCTGAWTMNRNAAYINQLYFRTKSWMNVFNDSNYRAFDEESLEPDFENMNSMLHSAEDVRRCCINDRTPPVLRRLAPDGTNQVFIAGMSTRFLQMNSTVTLRWEAHAGLSVHFVGNLGYGDTFRDEKLPASRWLPQEGMSLYSACVDNLSGLYAEIRLSSCCGIPQHGCS